MKHYAKRAIRRHHYQRLKNKVIDKNYFHHESLKWSSELAHRLGLYANTAKCWSCGCCSSPRYLSYASAKDRLSFQERRSLLCFKEFMAELV